MQSLNLAIARHTYVTAAPAISLIVENPLQLIQRCYPTAVIDEVPVDGVRVMAEVVIVQLLQPGQTHVNGGGASEIDVDGSGLGVHRGARWQMDDTTIHSLKDQEAKLLFIKIWLQLCHIDKMEVLCHADQDIRYEALRCWYSSPW